ncbi:ATP-binding cassette domain-containing protein [Thermithiobacillus plumbiphilus]|uniref:ATP-binding cassette domain-containing protein n=1 Tax=Thermithiobacillus plumbiphilus TaxID=1729899 RepID=A0ABU9DAU8_9PROT
MLLVPGGVVLQARALRKAYGDRVVVDGIDLRIAAGQCLGILGPNGAGKTTTMRMMLGQAPTDGGSLEVFGEPMPQRAEHIRARLGVVPQADNLDPDFTVYENLRIYGRYFGIPAPQLAQRIPELLNFAELTDRANSPIAALSGGMKRRLTLARALINDPELILLDEPTTGLDPQVRHLIWQRLRSLRQAGKTLVLTTHYMEEAERLCDEVIVMDNGRILAQGSPQSLIHQYVSPEVVEIRANHAGELPDLDSLPAQLYRDREIVADTAFFYLDSAGPLLEAVRQVPGISALMRPATLEDVFLKLTGRDLRD